MYRVVFSVTIFRKLQEGGMDLAKMRGSCKSATSYTPEFEYDPQLLFSLGHTIIRGDPISVGTAMGAKSESRPVPTKQSVPGSHFFTAAV